MAFRQYRKGDFILGSINQQSLWQQQRSVVAYWPSQSPAWHVNFCMDMSAQTFGNGYARYASVQEKGAVLAAITGKLPVPNRGGLRFGFNGEAKAREFTGGPAGSWVVEDGGVTAYICPVSMSGVKMTSQIDGEHSRVYVERPWSSADPIGKINALGYLVVFQLPGEAVPVVKDISMVATDEKVTLSASVNDKQLTLQIK